MSLSQREFLWEMPSECIGHTQNVWPLQVVQEPGTPLYHETQLFSKHKSNQATNNMSQWFKWYFGAGKHLVNQNNNKLTANICIIFVSSKFL